MSKRERGVMGLSAVHFVPHDAVKKHEGCVFLLSLERRAKKPPNNLFKYSLIKKCLKRSRESIS